MKIALVLFVIAIIFVVRSLKVVPQQNAWVVERLGKYHATLTPGLNFLMPFVDRVAYKHSLKEIPLDVPSQVCITRDNTQLQVDGILYFQVTDPMRASYGSSNYIVAVTQLAQTSLRSVIGKLELDKTFEERDIINAQVVAGHRRGGAELGREGAALRDQGPDAAQGNPACDAGADHRRARKARADRRVGRPRARSRSTSPPASARPSSPAPKARSRPRSTRRRARPPPSWPWPKPPPRHRAGRRGHPPARAASRRCS